MSTFNYDKDNQQNAELLYVIKSVMNLEINYNTNLNLNKIFDDRSMPSIFLINEINDSIFSKDDEKFLIHSLISINNKNWSDIHPEHLKILLNGYLEYNEGALFRNIILEVFRSYKFII